MTVRGAIVTDAELEALRADADLIPLVDALLRRGLFALDRGEWTAALRDLDEATVVAALAGHPERAAQARRAAAIALRADGRLLAAEHLVRS